MSNEADKAELCDFKGKYLIKAEKDGKVMQGTLQVGKDNQLQLVLK